MTAYYNEIDPEKAAWIRELIREGMVAPGEVDERSITDVRADDLRGFKQCHFFAGIAVWSYALRLADWPDDKPCWTGSCPCPSFSCAGKGEGFDDPRHLWPVWYPIVRECRPRVLFGEQSHDAIRFGWLDLVQSDMEAENYAFAPAVLGAHSVGAGHKRQRLYFCADSEAAEILARYGEVSAGAGKKIANRSGNGSLSRHSADAEHDGRDRSSGNAAIAHRNESQERIPNRDRAAEFSSNAEQRRRHYGRGLYRGCSEESGGAEASERSKLWIETERDGSFGDDEHSEREGLEGQFGNVRDWRGPGWLDPITARSVAEAGATRGFWGDCDWWHARDGKYRPIERGLFPLAHGTSNRVLKLRGYGDAIVPQVAQAFIESYLETSQQQTTGVSGRRTR